MEEDPKEKGKFGSERVFENLIANSSYGLFFKSVVTDLLRKVSCHSAAIPKELIFLNHNSDDAAPRHSPGRPACIPGGCPDPQCPGPPLYSTVGPPCSVREHFVGIEYENCGETWMLPHELENLEEQHETMALHILFQLQVRNQEGRTEINI